MTLGAVSPISGDTVWTRDAFASDDRWVHQLSPAALADIDRGVRAVRESGRALDDVTNTDFALPALAADFAEINHILGRGRGFVLIKGLSPERYGEDEMAIALWGIGTHLGVGVSQSWRGDRLGHVRNIGETDRYYTAGGEIEMHMDPVDVVGLLCLRKGVSGGLSRIASSMTVHNIILAERPDLMASLRDGFFYSRREVDRGGGGAVGAARIPVFAKWDGMPVCHYLPIAVRSAADLEGVEMSALEREALAFVDEVAQRPEVYLEMDFQPGDIQFLNNRVVLHARTDYVDHDRPELRRHLLRLWLMMPSWAALPENMRMHGAGDRLGGGIAKADTNGP